MHAPDMRQYQPDAPKGGTIVSANALIVLSQSGSLRRWFAQKGILRGAVRSTARLVVAILEHRLRRQTCLTLLALDDRMLADIGLQRDQILEYERTAERVHLDYLTR
jgi:uncharacterized protein YjiS (DUF1127 family)